MPRCVSRRVAAGPGRRHATGLARRDPGDRGHGRDDPGGGADVSGGRRGTQPSTPVRRPTSSACSRRGPSRPARRPGRAVRPVDARSAAGDLRPSTDGAPFGPRSPVSPVVGEATGTSGRLILVDSARHRCPCDAALGRGSHRGRRRRTGPGTARDFKPPLADSLPLELLHLRRRKGSRFKVMQRVEDLLLSSSRKGFEVAPETRRDTERRTWRHRLAGAAGKSAP